MTYKVSRGVTKSICRYVTGYGFPFFCTLLAHQVV